MHWVIKSVYANRYVKRITRDSKGIIPELDAQFQFEFTDKIEEAQTWETEMDAWVVKDVTQLLFFQVVGLG